MGFRALLSWFRSYDTYGTRPAISGGDKVLVIIASLAEKKVAVAFLGTSLLVFGHIVNTGKFSRRHSQVVLPVSSGQG